MLALASISQVVPPAEGLHVSGVQVDARSPEATAHVLEPPEARNDGTIVVHAQSGARYAARAVEARDGLGRASTRE